MEYLRTLKEQIKNLELRNSLLHKENIKLVNKYNRLFDIVRAMIIGIVIGICLLRVIELWKN